MLGPTSPYRVSATILQFSVARDGSALGPQGVTKLLARIPVGTLSLSNSQASAKPIEREVTTLVESWDTAIAELPSDWSDLYAEVELDSSDYLERGALLLAPVNPARVKEQLAYRFRVARVFGYGASAEMTERCLQRLDAEGISGHFHVLRSLSDSKPVATQGPVWYVGGQAV